MAIISYKVSIPVANPLRFTRDSESSNERANYDQRRMAQLKNATTEEFKSYDQLWEKTDSPLTQIYTNYPKRRIKIINCDEEVVLGPFDLDLLHEYRNKVFRADCKFASLNGFLFVYFEEGFTYDDDAFDYPLEEIDWQGRLPGIQAAVGDTVLYSIGGGDFESAIISEIAWYPTVTDRGAHGFLLNIPSALVSPVDGQIAINYNEKELDLFGLTVALAALPEGLYFARLEFGISDYSEDSFTSERLNVAEEHRESLAIQYRHNGNFDDADRWHMLYAAEEYALIRVPADFYKFIVGGEVEADMDDTGEGRILRAVPYRQLAFSALNIPGWLVDKFALVFSHDTKVINGYEWEIDNLGEFNVINQIDTGTFEITLKQKGDRTIATWEKTVEVSAFWEPSSIVDQPFGGSIVTATLHTSAPGLFRFLALPAWISADMEEFEDGDEVEFTLAANAGGFERNASLIAESDEIDGLTATLDINQLFDDTVPEFIDAAPTSFNLSGNAGANTDILISASSAWEAIIQSGHAFTLDADGLFPDGVLNISEPTQNTGAERVGVVRVRLISNPAIFKDINITQTTLVTMVLLTPGLIQVDANDHDVTTDVSTSGVPSWQATSIADWLHFNTGVQIGNAIGFAIHVDAKPPYIAPRTATITFYNISNMSDQLSLEINQTD